LDNTLTLSVSGQAVTITLSGGSTFSGGSTLDDLTIDGIKNPATPGTTGTFTITTTDSSDATIDSGTAAGIEIEANLSMFLMQISADRENAKIGEVITFTANFENLTDATIQGVNVWCTMANGIMYRNESATISGGGSFTSTEIGTTVKFSDFEGKVVVTALGGEVHSP